MNLTETEKRTLQQGGLEKDIDTINRTIDAKLEGRQDWTTLTDTVSPPHQSPQPIRVLIVGETGVGKSALGNVLLSTASFNTSGRSAAETMQFQEAVGVYREEKIILLDTPGYTKYGTFEKEINSKMNGVDVFILVINNSSRRSADLDIKSLRDTQVLNDQTIKQFILVGTHSQAHYSNKGVDTFIQDVSEDPEVKSFIDKIKNHVVLVELGTGPVTAKAAKRGMAVYDKEIEQARDMVMSMVYEVINAQKGIGSTSADNESSWFSWLYPSNWCKWFPSIATVYTTQGKKEMKDLCLNDHVLVRDKGGSLEYEQVVMFTHADPDEQSEFVSLTTKSGKVLHTYARHLLHVGASRTLKAAHKVTVGDIVFAVENGKPPTAVEDEVVAVGSKQMNGFHCPYTPSGSIVVDGILVSCYTDILPTVVAQGALILMMKLQSVIPKKWFPLVLSQNNV